MLDFDEIDIDEIDIDKIDEAEYDRIVEAIKDLDGLETIDITGTLLSPGDPENCLGNGEHEDFPLCCDECDFHLECFPEHKKGVERNGMTVTEYYEAQIESKQMSMAQAFREIEKELGYDLPPERMKAYGEKFMAAHPVRCAEYQEAWHAIGAYIAHFVLRGYNVEAPIEDE